MKKALKVIGLSLLLVLIVLLVAVLAHPAWISPVARILTKTIPPKVINTPAAVDAFHLNAYSGRLEINDFQLGNPQERGFSTNDSFSVSNILVKVQPSSLTKDTIVVETIHIMEPAVRVETFGSLMNFLAMAEGDPNKPTEKKADKPKEEKPAEESEGEGSSKSIQLDDFLLSNARFAIVSNSTRQASAAIGDIKASLNKQAGSLSIDNIAVANPDGFTKNDAFSLKKLAVEIDPAFLTDTNAPIRVRKAEIVDPSVRVETLGSQLNFLAMIPATGEKKDEAEKLKSEEAEKPKVDDAPMKLPIVDLFSLTNAKFVVASNATQQTAATVADISAKLDEKQGALSINGIRVVNPDGFTKNDAFSLKKLTVEIDPAFLTNTNAPIRVKKVEIVEPSVRVETLGSQLNFLAMAPVMGEKKDEAEKLKSEEAEKPKADNAPMKLPVLELFSLKDAKVIVASNATQQTAATVADISAKLDEKQGALSIDGIRVVNPDGFSKNDAFSLKKFAVEIDPAFITDSNAPIHVRNIDIDSPSINMETLGSQINFLAMAPAIGEKKDEAEKLKSGDVEKQESEKTEKPMKLPVIDRFSLRNTQFTLASKEARQTAASIADISAKLDTKQGALSINGIRVANPDGFTKNDVFSLKKFAVEIDPTFITDTNAPIHVKNIEIVEPRIRLEVQGDKMNVACMSPVLEEGEKPESKTVQADPPKEPAETKPAASIPTILLDNFCLTNTVVDVMSNDVQRLGVTIGGVSASMDTQTGLVTVASVRVTNPQGMGYTTNDAVAVESIQVDLEPESLNATNNIIHIRSIDIARPVIRVENMLANLLSISKCFPGADETNEVKEASGTATNAVAAADEKAQKTESENADATTDGGKKVIIDRLLVHDGTIQFSLAGKTIPIPLPTVELKDLGKDKGGLTFLEATQLIGETLLKVITSAISGVTGLAVDMVGGALSMGTNVLGTVIGGKTMNAIGNTGEGAVKAIGNVGGGAVKAVGDVGGGAVKAVGDIGGGAVKAVGNIGKGIGGLFGGNDEKKDEEKEKKEEKPADKPAQPQNEAEAQPKEKEGNGALNAIKKLF
ncbi:MAG: hypothetical protein IKR48_12830 [Kiritimatiellae bacterium]|nr:hypothetical protein [Kiritimatiellia bacterium]